MYRIDTNLPFKGATSVETPLSAFADTPRFLLDDTDTPTPETACPSFNDGTVFLFLRQDGRDRPEARPATLGSLLGGSDLWDGHILACSVYKDALIWPSRTVTGFLIPEETETKTTVVCQPCDIHVQFTYTAEEEDVWQAVANATDEVSSTERPKRGMDAVVAASDPGSGSRDGRFQLELREDYKNSGDLEQVVKFEIESDGDMIYFTSLAIPGYSGFPAKLVDLGPLEPQGEDVDTMDWEADSGAGGTSQASSAERDWSPVVTTAYSQSGDGSDRQEHDSTFTFMLIPVVEPSSSESSSEMRRLELGGLEAV